MNECREKYPITFYHKFIKKKKYNKEMMKIQKIVDGLRNYVKCVHRGRHFINQGSTETCVTLSRLDFFC